MNLDQSTVLSDAQAVTGGSAGVASTYYIDLGAASKPIAQPAFVEVRVDTTCVGGGSDTIEFKLQGADAGADLASSGHDIATTGPISEASSGLIAGKVFRIPFPINNPYRYVGLFIKPSATFSAGKVDAYVTLTPYQR